MTSDDLRSEALDYMTSAQIAALAIADLRAADPAVSRIGEGDQAISVALQLAQVHALLYIGDTLAAVLSEIASPAPISIPGADDPLICRYNWCEHVAEIGSDFCADHQ